MKKILLTFVLGIAFAGGAHPAFADTSASCPTGSDNECPGAQVCNPDTKQCMVDPQDGLSSIGDACTNDNQCRGNSVQCDPTSKKCAYDTGATTPTGATPTAGGAAATPTTASPVTGAPGGSASTGNFVPLTNLPIFGSGNLTSSPTLPGFLNSLYLYCVGIAAVLAVVQIMHAGLLYMGGDSVTETKQAKSLITSSILGLVLVLSPVIVFGIINKKILSLDVGFGQLAPAASNNTSASSPSGSSSSATPAYCANYPTTQWAQVPTGKLCKDSLGPAWVSLTDNVCCSGTQPNNATCCGQNPNYVAPTPSALFSSIGYDIVYQDTDPNTYKACVADDVQGNFKTKAACLASFNGTISATKVPYAISRSCGDSGSHEPPTGAGWNTLKNLPACPAQ